MPPTDPRQHSEMDLFQRDVTNYKSVIMAKDLTAVRAIHASDETGNGGGMG